MQYVIDLFLFIGTLIAFVFAFVGAFFTTLGNVFRFLYGVATSLPVVLQAGAVCIIAVSVLYKILKRESSG